MFMVMDDLRLDVVKVLEERGASAKVQCAGRSAVFAACQVCACGVLDQIATPLALSCSFSSPFCFPLPPFPPVPHAYK